jgi:hypothetical protein
MSTPAKSGNALLLNGEARLIIGALCRSRRAVELLARLWGLTYTKEADMLTQRYHKELNIRNVQ